MIIDKPNHASWTRLLVYLPILCFNLLTGYEPNKPLRVLFLTTRFPSIAQTPMFNQAASLIDRGVDLHIFAEKELPQDVVHDVVKKYQLNSIVSYRQLPKKINKYDIIHIQYEELWQPYLELLSNYKGKIVFSLRGSERSSAEQLQAIIAKINTMIDLYLPVCDIFRNKLIVLGVDPNKIRVLHSSINLQNFPYKGSSMPESGKIEILSVARLVPKKGLDDALKAIAEVKKAYPNINYTIIGHGKYKETLVELAKSLEIEDVVTFAGLKSAAEVEQALSSSHLFLLPSKTTESMSEEGIPNALKEAMSVGLPVVSTIHAGIPELIKDGISGYLVPEGEPLMIAEKILHLINHPEIWEQMSHEGRAVIEQEYDMEIVNEQLYHYYQNLMAESPL